MQNTVILNETDKTPNKKQQEAIDIMQGSVMLLAGPGTGKTFTVIKRIEKMLSCGINPDEILCLTFSDAAASEMRNRLIKKMGVTASSVDVYTYHSFCNDIIKNYPAQFELSVDVRMITETEKIDIMKECIDQAELQYFVPSRADKYYYTKNFISLIENLKSKRLSKEQYMKRLEENPSLLPRLKELKAEIEERESKGNSQNKTRYAEVEKITVNIHKAKELWNLYELYSKKMINRNLIDFADMINFVLDAFEEDAMFLSEVSNKYSYFFVDEYQDTNELQNKIIFKLLEGNKKKNIFVVGDDDQIIYGFQGAKSDNIETFLNTYPQTKVICLEENNRSTQTILDFSNLVISQDVNRLENNEQFKEKYGISKKLTAKNNDIIQKDNKIKLRQFKETLQEFNHTVQDIVNLINCENCPKNDNGEKDLSKIAIITKKRAELQTFAELFKGKNIPFQIDEGKNIFSVRSSILIYFYLKALNNHILNSDKLFGLLLAPPFKLDIEDYNSILHQKQILNNNKPNDFITLMKTMQNWKNPEKIKKFLDTFEDLKDYAATNNLRSTIIEIINRTGILEYFYKSGKNRMENIVGIRKIISEAENFQKIDITRGLQDFVLYLDDCLKNDIEISSDKDLLVQNAVQLMTYHGSKGREFDYVYLPNLISSNWENFRMPGEYKLVTDEVLDKDEASAKKDSELLKLLFVGITRAKHTLVLSFADNNDSRSQQITKYLANFKNQDFDFAQYDCDAQELTTEFFRSISTEVYDNQKAFRNEIEQRVKSIVLSPSRLNDYLACPRKFFYLKVLGIDVEDADWDSANFGSVIHSILEKSVKYAKEKGQYPDICAVTGEFQNAVNNTKFTSLAQKEKYLRLGNNLINNYYPYFSQFSVSRIEDVEFNFYGVKVGDDLITGKIDRIEKNSDGTYSLYDYKTGRAASEKEIAPQKSKERYYNQLCFYKYAYEKYTNNKVSVAGIIYVEEHNKSIHKVLTDEDMEYIENLIKETYANIKNLKFEPVKENSEVCRQCVYKQLCKLDLI